MIHTKMSGQEIDRVLRTILDAMKTENNDKVAYIKRGDLAFEDGEKLFGIAILG